MSQKDKKQQGELSEDQLDDVSGGQEVVKMETITVTASREKPDVSGTKIASVSVPKKNN